MPWEKTYDKTDVLNRAMQTFWARGYEAASMNDLVDAMGINRGSIYAAFDSKRALFLEVLHHYDDIHRRQYLDRISKTYAGTAAILAVFETAASGAPRKGKPGGCLLVNTALELSPHDPEVRRLIDACFTDIENFFAARLIEAQKDGEFDPAKDVRNTAQALLGMFLGLRVLTRSAARRPAINGVIRQTSALLS